MNNIILDALDAIELAEILDYFTERLDVLADHDLAKLLFAECSPYGLDDLRADPVAASANLRAEPAHRANTVTSTSRSPRRSMSVPGRSSTRATSRSDRCRLVLAVVGGVHRSSSCLVIATVSPWSGAPAPDTRLLPGETRRPVGGRACRSRQAAPSNSPNCPASAGGRGTRSTSTAAVA